MPIHRHYKIAVIAGDGIGKEVTPAALARRRGRGAGATASRCRRTDLPWGCEYYLAETAA